MKKIILFLAFINCNLLAQMDEFAIRSSDKYYTGQAESNQLEEAKAAAKTDLVNNIVSIVKNAFINEIVENDSALTKNSRTSSKSVSLVKLKNLKYLEVEPVNLKFRIIAYIDKKDYYSAVNDIKTEIRESFKRVEQLEKEDGLIKTAPNYFLTYLKSFYCPEPIKCYSLIEQDSILSLRNYIEEKISDYLSDIELSAEYPKVSKNIDEQFDVELKAFYKGKPVDKIHARFDLPDNPNRKVNDGSSLLYLFNEPSFPNQKLMVSLSMFADKKGDLAELEKDFNIEYKKEIKLDFSKVISIDFNIDDKGGGLVYFQPDIKHLSISKIDWDFGDNAQSNEVNTKHIYKNLDTFTVKMRVNSSEEMLITHKIKFDISSKKFVIDESPKQSDEQKGVYVSANQNNDEVVSDLITKRDFKDLITQLEKYKQRGKVMWGRENDFANPDNCYIFIIDQVTQKTIAVFEKGKSDRKDLLNNSICSDINKTYTGKSAIFVEVY